MKVTLILILTLEMFKRGQIEQWFRRKQDNGVAQSFLND